MKVDKMKIWIDWLNHLGCPVGRFWATFWKQEVQDDQRAFDIVAKAEVDCQPATLGPDPSKASLSEYAKYFEKCVNL